MSETRFASYVRWVLAFNLGVVLWGAFVRATGSGAGCGSHWPLCNGTVVPRAPETATLIEFGHRLTSGVALLLVLGMLVWARRAYSPGHPVRTGAALSMGLMIVEALLGAGLVLFELVADNPSLIRAWSMAAHLLNTFLLLGAITLTMWWSSGGGRIRLRGQGRVATLLLTGIAGVLLVGVTGAMTALGDTLFPASTLAEGLRQDASPTAHLLVRLRVLHPVLAVLVGAFLLVVARTVARLRPSRATVRLAQALSAVYAIQLAAGALNVALLVPIWLQLLHLLLADLLWIVLVLLAASVLSETGINVAFASSPQRSSLAARRHTHAVHPFTN